jgi:hypothetical protein
MLSWRGAVGGGAGLGGFVMVLLLDDGGIAPGAWPKTSFEQQVMQLRERRRRHAWWAEFHPGARDRVEHPRRDHRDHTGCHLDVDDLTYVTFFAATPPDTEAVERMPAIVDHDLLPDMGRMTG